MLILFVLRGGLSLLKFHKIPQYFFTILMLQLYVNLGNSEEN
ncbi:hypothetical protein ZPR_0287 [Zunongwangia profunda SM-A87]|uniref:Uncharacterized protein n=1 Tax=Zunongwangia profunda (strain DSM 18752 / CCTCC AB 206139 / SM-A87) TaxID=655815 RepID=D5BDQ7_ZUNPS|nr:hypothetical protein ZPR_0287 [Zunongwangia profunda SM-A87]